MALPPQRAALGLQGTLCDKGDAGSIIVDRDFRPVAMIWGGDDHSVAKGPTEVTYASPLCQIFRDIERRLQWAEGSVSMS